MRRPRPGIPAARPAPARRRHEAEARHARPRVVDEVEARDGDVAAAAPHRVLSGCVSELGRRRRQDGGPRVPRTGGSAGASNVGSAGASRYVAGPAGVGR